MTNPSRTTCGSFRPHQTTRHWILLNDQNGEIKYESRHPEWPKAYLDKVGCNRSSFTLMRFSALDNLRNLFFPFLLSHIYTSLPKRDPPNPLEENPLISSFLKSNFLSYFLPFYNPFPHRNNICAILLKNKNYFFFKILLTLLPNRWRPVSSCPKAKKYDLKNL